MQPGQGSGDRHAEDGVERRPQERLLDPPLEMQEDLEKAVKEPEKHRGRCSMVGLIEDGDRGRFRTDAV